MVEVVVGGCIDGGGHAVGQRPGSRDLKGGRGMKGRECSLCNKLRGRRDRVVAVGEDRKIVGEMRIVWVVVVEGV